MAGEVSQGSGNKDRAVVDQLKMLRILFSIFNVLEDRPTLDTAYHDVMKNPGGIKAR